MTVNVTRAGVAWDDSIYSRQHDVLPVDKTRRLPITIVGAGHVGSKVALMLVQCGALSGDQPFTVIDPDIVEVENVPMQFYRPDQAGKPKVEALIENLEMFGVIGNPKAIHGPFDPKEHKLSGIVISGVDNMGVRKEIFDACCASTGVDLFIDVRTGGEVIRVFSINPQLAAEQKFYMNNWHPDDSAAQDPCTNRGISWTTFQVAAEVGVILGAYWRGLPLDSMVEFDMRNRMQFRTNCGFKDRIEEPKSKIEIPTIDLKKLKEEIKCTKSATVRF